MFCDEPQIKDCVYALELKEITDSAEGRLGAGERYERFHRGGHT